MFRPARMRMLATFLSGVVVGVAALIFLGGGNDQITAPAAQAATAEQKEMQQVGRYQAFSPDKGLTTAYACLLDTATGKVWQLKLTAGAPATTYKWDLLADGPK